MVAGQMHHHLSLSSWAVRPSSHGPGSAEAPFAVRARTDASLSVRCLQGWTAPAVQALLPGGVLVGFSGRGRGETGSLAKCPEPQQRDASQVHVLINGYTICRYTMPYGKNG